MNVIGWRFHKGCNVDDMWMLLDEDSIRVIICNVDNMWMLLDEGSIIKGV